MTSRRIDRNAIIIGVSAAIMIVAAAVALPEAAFAQSPTAPPAPVKPAPAPVKGASPAVSAGTSAVVMDLSAIESVIGKSVKSSGGEDLGRIVDLLVTPAGQVRAAVIDFGGLLGVGSRKVAVDWKALDFAAVAKDGTVRLALTRNQVRVAPEYKSDDPVVILQATKPEEGKPAVAAEPADKSGKPGGAPQAPKQ